MFHELLEHDQIFCMAMVIFYGKNSAVEHFVISGALIQVLIFSERQLKMLVMDAHMNLHICIASMRLVGWPSFHEKHHVFKTLFITQCLSLNRSLQLLRAPLQTLHASLLM